MRGRTPGSSPRCFQQAVHAISTYLLHPRTAFREFLFYPAGHFRERFYRFDVVSLVLETQDVQLALQQANEAQKATARSPLASR